MVFFEELEKYLCAAGIEIFVLDLAFCISIQCIGVVSSKFFYIKMFRSHSDFLVRGKSDGKRSVRKLFSKDMFQYSDDLSNSCLVICTQDRSAIGGDECPSLQRRKVGKYFRGKGPSA